MGTIDNICKFDPQFRRKLNEHLNQVSNLQEAELLLKSDGPFVDMTFEECLKIVTCAACLIESYEVIMEEIDPETGEISDTDKRILKWDKTAILKDRFGYLAETIARSC
jgi:uncharacterized protein YydD (DUF2326 family)